MSILPTVDHPSRHSPNGKRADGWHITHVCLFPIVAGAAAPWLIWLCAGTIDCAEVAAVSFASALIYLRTLWHLGELEAAARMRLGRRYSAPGPLVALAVCSGLAGCFTMPGVSTFALVGAVGMPWQSPAPGLVSNAPLT